MSSIPISSPSVLAGMTIACAHQLIQIVQYYLCRACDGSGSTKTQRTERREKDSVLLNPFRKHAINWDPLRPFVCLTKAESDTECGSLSLPSKGLKCVLTCIKRFYVDRNVHKVSNYLSAFISCTRPGHRVMFALHSFRCKHHIRAGCSFRPSL